MPFEIVFVKPLCFTMHFSILSPLLPLLDIFVIKGPALEQDCKTISDNIIINFIII